MLYQVYILLFQDKVAQFMLLKTTYFALHTLVQLLDEIKKLKRNVNVLSAFNAKQGVIWYNKYRLT